MNKEKINRDLADLFREAKEILARNTSPLIDRHREEAYRHFTSQGGIPANTEEYRHANLLPLFDRDYHVALNPRPLHVTPGDLFTCNVPALDTRHRFTINGWPVNNPGEPTELPGGVIACSLSDAAKYYPRLVEQHYNRHATTPPRDPLVQLNTAFARDGIFLHVPDGITLDKPLQIVNLMLGNNNNIMSFQRDLIVIGKGATATILACDHTLSDHAFLANNVTEIALDENASIQYYQVQNQHSAAARVHSTCITQERQSRLDANIITLHGGYTRDNLLVTLRGEESQCNLHGIYLPDKQQQVDNHTIVDHAAPRCQSNELFKGILDDHATANFTGRVIVRPGAKKTSAYQANHNLLLTNTARVNTRPQLVIDADDVKCTHGATVGQLDDDATFYLRSRGIPKEEARLMMMAAFAREITGKVHLAPLREQLDDLLEKRLRGELSKCHDNLLHCKRST
ncbi:MAG: Fe-S cluster assembly protein SufD [Odoribacteraceae bacterium]|jgi:Fe-S cluster assembly protein SufD|nr:Fe-S cluster assembly protein SufD [Odoribacteraceae bacterium]